MQDAVDHNADVPRGSGAERSFGSLRGRRRAPRRFGGWQGSRRPTGRYNRLVRANTSTVDATDPLAVIVLVTMIHSTYSLVLLI